MKRYNAFKLSAGEIARAQALAPHMLEILRELVNLAYRVGENHLQRTKAMTIQAEELISIVEEGC